jgi:hypothetical protein
MTVQDFFNKYQGLGIDFDGYYGNQCMDEFLQYNQDVVHAPRVYGNAVDVWSNYPTAFYTQIPNTPDGVPQIGDVMIWGTGIGPYGHIAICKEGDVNSFTSLDQNWNNAQFCQFITHNYNALLGWLRPIQPVVDIPEPTPAVEIPPTPIVEQPAPVVVVTPTPTIEIPVTTSESTTIIPVVIPSTPIETAPSEPQTPIIPPVEAKPIAQHGPVKTPMRLPDLIVWTLKNTISVLSKLWNRRNH